MIAAHLLTLPRNHPVEAMELPPSQVPPVYRARFLSSGPDVAIEISKTEVRCYVDAEICGLTNAFTDYASARRETLRLAWRHLSNGPEDVVVLVGRWHRPDIGEGVFDAYEVHVINEQGTTTRPYRLNLFEHDYHQYAESIEAPAEIDGRFFDVLEVCSRELLSQSVGDLTQFGIPYADGVVWQPGTDDRPSIFCDIGWPQGLDSTDALKTLEFAPTAYRFEFDCNPERAPDSITLGVAMGLARRPIYSFQIRLEDGKTLEPNLCHFNVVDTDYAEAALARIVRKEAEAETFTYASEWINRRSGFDYRILI